MDLLRKGLRAVVIFRTVLVRGATWRGVALLLRSAPVAVAALVSTQLVEGLGPVVAIAASSTLLNRAPAAGHSASARSATITAVLVIGGVLVLVRAASSLNSMLLYLVRQRFGAAVDQLRIRAAAAFPGLGQFDDPALSDRLQASQWAAEAANLVNYGGFLVRWASTGVSATVVAARIGWWVPLLLAIAAIPGGVLAWRHLGHQKGLQRSRAGVFRFAGYHTQLAVGLQPGREVRLFGLADWLLDRQERTWWRAMDALLADLRSQMHRGVLLATLKVSAAAVPFVVAYHRLIDGSLSRGDFSAAVIALAAVIGVMQLIEAFPSQVRSATEFLPDLFELVDQPQPEPHLRAGGSARPPAAPQLGIRFEGVTFTYAGTSRPVLEDLDLWLPAGSSLALVGPNGCGKSTLVKLLCRFYDPEEGRITLDGVDLRDLDLDAWRERLAVVFQDFLKLPETVAVNVGVGSIHQLGDQALLKLAAAEAGAAELVGSLPQGWDTVLAREFGGVDLSGGEWQRLILARALMARHGRLSTVLVLDEPTAPLDVRLEHDLFTRFASLTSGLTTLLISHRFSTVRMADSVAVLAGGRVDEEGTHEALMSQGGRYAELYALQAKRFV